MITKQEALDQIVSLTKEHGLTLEEITSVLGKQQIESHKKNPGNLIKVFSYLGGIFILAGLSGYIALVWESLNSVSRILITLGPGIICLIIASVSELNKKGSSKAKNFTVLIVLSAFLQTTGLFVAIYEFSTGGGNIRFAALLIFSALCIEYLIFFSKIRRTSLLFFSVTFLYFSFINLFELINLSDNLTQLICGSSLLALSYGIQRTPYNSICGFGYFISSITLLWMGFDLLKHSYLEVLYLGISCFMLYVSTIVNSRSILVTSVIATFSYISYFTAEHFSNSLGWPVCLILLGFLFFGISNLAFKINKKIV